MVELAWQYHRVSQDYFKPLVFGKEFWLQKRVKRSSSTASRGIWKPGWAAVMATQGTKPTQGVVHLVLDRLEVLVGRWFCATQTSSGRRVLGHQLLRLWHAWKKNRLQPLLGRRWTSNPTVGRHEHPCKFRILWQFRLSKKLVILALAWCKCVR